MLMMTMKIDGKDLAPTCLQSMRRYVELAHHLLHLPGWGPILSASPPWVQYHEDKDGDNEDDHDHDRNVQL